METRDFEVAMKPEPVFKRTTSESSLENKDGLNLNIKCSNIQDTTEQEEIIDQTEDSLNWTQICRICACASDHIIPVFEGEGAEHELSDKIHKYLPIKVSVVDDLPRQLCYHCAATILAWDELLEGCLDAEKRLVQMHDEMQAQEQTQLPYEDTTILHELAEVADGLVREQTLIEGSFEELIDDPDPVEFEDSKQLGEIVEYRAKNMDSTGSSNVSKRSGRTKKAFKVFLETQNICRKSRKAKKKCTDDKSVMSDNTTTATTTTNTTTATIWGDAASTSVEHSSIMDSPGTRDEDCANEAFSIKIEQKSTENSTTKTAENLKRDTIIATKNKENSLMNTATSIHKKSSTSHKASHSSGTEVVAKCAICCLEFSWINDLHTHVKKHKVLPEAGNVYQCVKCPKSFRLKDSFTRHLRIHKDERPYTCHICGKQFRDSGGLSRHLKDVHAKLKNFSCDICGNSFSSKATRDDHRRIHTGERPYTCDTCKKSFKSKACLYIHSKLHTNEFPHPCTYCNKKFRRRQEMLAHVTTHTGEKNYSCDVCLKKFRVKTEVVRHKMSHSEEKPFVCAKCGLKFRQNRYLNNHIRTRHVKTSKDC